MIGNDPIISYGGGSGSGGRRGGGGSPQAQGLDKDFPANGLSTRTGMLTTAGRQYLAEQMTEEARRRGGRETDVSREEPGSPTIIAQWRAGSVGSTASSVFSRTVRRLGFTPRQEAPSPNGDQRPRFLLRLGGRYRGVGYVMRTNASGMNEVHLDRS